MSASQSKSCNKVKPRGEFRFKQPQNHDRSQRSCRSSTIHRRRRREKAVPDTQSAHYNETPPPYIDGHLAPDVAFRESLFDALADEAGAAFWQGVYGQPIHNYSNSFTDPETGEIEIMDNEQYAAFVRRKIWEKSREGVEAAREERKRHRNKPRQDTDDENQDRPPLEVPHADVREYEIFDLEMDNSIRRANTRKKRKYWQDRWREYQRGWDNLDDLCRAYREASADHVGQVPLLDRIPWPIESGSSRDLSAPEVRKFFDHVAAHNNAGGDETQVRHTMMKTERVRWHPDKMQQRYGGLCLEKHVMEHITAVFQILDELRTENLRGKA